MARRKFVCGNWKMFKTSGEAANLVRELRNRLSDTQLQVAIAPPFTALESAHAALAGSKIELYAQNCYFEKHGAFTGEIAPQMLASAGCNGVILGHSERRTIFGEDDALIAKKIRAALEARLAVIACVGETLAEREANQTWEVVSRQTRAALNGLSPEQLQHMTIAYEPVWAIGTGKVATAAQAQEVHAQIRGLVRELFSAQIADALRIQYGGSVKPENAAELLNQPDIDGALVGGASLKADDFARIIAGARRHH